MKNAIALRRTLAPAALDNRSTIIAVCSPVPREIQDGILALPVAFSAGRSLDQAERDIQAKLYLEAIEGFEAFIADFVLRRIRLFNPRNPFPPTPQDVREHCSATKAALHRAVSNAAVCGEKWRPHGGSLPPGWFGEIDEEPFAPGCIVPDPISAAWIRHYIASIAFRDSVADLRAFCEHSEGYGSASRNYHHACTSRPEIMRRASLEAIRRLPDDALPEGFRAAYESAAAHFAALKCRSDEEHEADAKRRLEKYGVQVFSLEEFER